MRPNGVAHRVSSSSPVGLLYEVELHRGSRGFGFAIRGGKEFAGMPICVLNIASGGSADRDGRLQVRTSVTMHPLLSSVLAGMGKFVPLQTLRHRLHRRVVCFTMHDCSQKL